MAEIDAGHVDDGLQDALGASSGPGKTKVEFYIMYIIVLTKAAFRAIPTAILAAFAWISPAVAQTTETYTAACFYSDHTGSFEMAKDCATTDIEHPQIAPHIVERLHYDQGLAQISIAQSGIYYRNRDGRMIRMFVFDNGPDPFSQGRARAHIDGRLAYVDRRLRVRIRTGYDWGEPFENGRAAVCIGCALTPVDGGEHHVVTGGRWGMIDCHGRELVPLRYTAAELAAQRPAKSARGCPR